MAQILATDPELRRAIHGVIARADHMIQDEVLAAVKAAAMRNEMSLSLLSHDDATRGLKRYYADIKAAGKFVKLW
jgi:hypothetical protein